MDDLMYLPFGIFSPLTFFFFFFFFSSKVYLLSTGQLILWVSRLYSIGTYHSLPILSSSFFSSAFSVSC